MSDDAKAVIFTAVLCILIFGTILTGIAIYEAGRGDIRREAVRAGVAHYTADESGKPVFTWKEARP